MNFLAAVNRVLRSNGIIRGDDDPVTTFTDAQHNASLNLAIITIQDELTDLVSDKLLSYEKAQGTLSLVASTRVYALASDFVRFFDVALFYDAQQNIEIFEYPGGEESLRLEIYEYRTTQGNPNWWYWEHATTKKVAFYQVPNTSCDGRVYAYDYQKDVSVSSSSDTLPFQTESEAQAFCGMASRRFKAHLEDLPDPLAFILRDPSYITSRTRLVTLMRPKDPSRNYSVGYR